MGFNIGDEITLIVNNPSSGCLQAGDVGVIKGKDEEGEYESYAVEFEFVFTDMHDCQGLVSSGRGWFISTEEMILSKDSRRNLSQEKAELLDVLRKLWSVRSQPWTDEQAKYKFKVECEVEEVLKKYDGCGN